MIDERLSALLTELGGRGESRFSELLQSIGNPRTLSKKLKELSSLGMVECRGGAYSLTEKGRRALELVRKWRELIGSPGAEIRNVDRIPHRVFSEVLERYCRLLLEHFGQRLLGVLVFGSVARGDWTPDSDIDLLVVVEGWRKPTWERSRELAGLVSRLYQTREYRRAVERGFTPVIQHYPLDGEEARRPHRIYIDACVDGIILYERGGFLTQVLGEFRERMAKLGASRVYLPRGYYWVLWRGKAGEVFEL